MDYATVSGAALPVEAVLPGRKDSVASRKLLRFGGFTMDSFTGTVRWRGEQLHLNSRDRELLGILLRRAGQIISCERLAAMLNARTDAVEARISSLRHSLESAGVGIVPRSADGCGYVLWG